MDQMARVSLSVWIRISLQSSVQGLTILLPRCSWAGRYVTGMFCYRSVLYTVSFLTAAGKSLQVFGCTSVIRAPFWDKFHGWMLPASVHGRFTPISDHLTTRTVNVLDALYSSGEGEDDDNGSSRGFSDNGDYRPMSVRKLVALPVDSQCDISIYDDKVRTTGLGTILGGDHDSLFLRREAWTMAWLFIVYVVSRHVLLL